MTVPIEATPQRWPYMKDLLDTYFYLDPSSDESLEDKMERVKADCPAAEVSAIRTDIANLLGLDDLTLHAVFETALNSYYWPGGDGLTTRAWLTKIDRFLAAPPDMSRDHRSGVFR